MKEIKERYQRVRSRIALQANYGALEFNWMLGRDIVQKNAIARWGDGVVNQLSLDLRNAFPDAKGFSSRNLYYMKEWYEFYWIKCSIFIYALQIYTKMTNIRLFEIILFGYL